MNRKTAIYRLLLLGGAGAGIIAGVKGYELYKRPDLGKLKTCQALIDEMAETILPATDSPGAKEAGVGAFITRMLLDCTGRKSQNNFLEGLDEITLYTIDHFDKPFLQCDPEERRKTLAFFEKKGKRHKGILGKAENYIFGSSFFETLKRYTVLGYCTSKEGATKGLRYQFIPGKYIGSIPLAANDKAWATH